MAATRQRTGSAGLAGVCLAIALVCLWSGAARAAAPDPAALLKRIAVTSAREVPFEERRYFGALPQALISRGTLRFEPPDRLIKRTETPQRETAIADADSLRVENADGVETAHIDLWMSADLRLIFDSLRAVLRGDAAALRTLFDVTSAGDDGAWTLTLTPRPDSEASRIERIVVTGGGDHIDRFDFFEADGNRSLIRMLDTPPRP